MKKNEFFLRILCFTYSLCMTVFAHATSTPMFTFAALTPTTASIANNENAIVQYIVTNMSPKAHTLMMMPVSGITQITSPGNCPSPFILAARQSCTLTLQIYGNQISSHLVGGPKVCQQGPNGKPSPYQCYQPSPANILNISVATAHPLILYAGTQAGNVYYSINEGNTWTATNPPAAGNAINSITATSTILYTGNANGRIYSSFNNGQTWSSIATPAPGFAVNGLYISANYKLYVASANGYIFICALNGTNCLPTTSPASGSAVNSVFVRANLVYAASANGYVYYSDNNGLTWSAINGQPDGSAVKTVYVATNTLYVGTANEYVYTSTALAGGGTWTSYAQTVYSLFVNANGSIINAGTQGGYVFSLVSGNELGFITYSPINSVWG
ncbi:MAG: hypothetical protein QM652_06845 [Legionella sp.]|uniref:WD40/YVTN/BNR-like repeat-containing protein n=1 Tax=Legionella sp. TaxID=459 RepID=UPI0039E2A807